MSNDKLMLMGATMAADGIKSFCRKVILNNHKKTLILLRELELKETR